MGSILSAIGDDEDRYRSWCAKNGKEFYNEDLYEKGTPYEQMEKEITERKRERQAEWDKKHPKEVAAKKIKEKKDRKTSGVLDKSWDGAQKTKQTPCPKCKNKFMLIQGGFLLTEEFACPKCGHTFGGDW